jgi:molybdenum cofactor guanylyltransferase
MDAVSGIIVAGGRSRRLGEDKRRLRLWGEAGPTLLEHTLQVIAPLCDEIIVVLNDPEAWPQLPARLVPDRYPDGGVLGGIFSGLSAAAQPYALVVASDMPLLNTALLQAMLAYPRTYDALVPRSPASGAARNALNVEPLHAIYSRACAGPLQTALERGQRRVIDFFAQVSVATIEPDEQRRYDPQGHSFLNVNTPDELARVRALFSGAPSAG